MVRGINSFRQWFYGYEEQYTIIGGTACDLLMTEEGLDFRATKDIDLVLIVEAVDASFGRKFWEYVITAGYEHRNKSTGELSFTLIRKYSQQLIINADKQGAKKAESRILSCSLPFSFTFYV